MFSFHKIKLLAVITIALLSVGRGYPDTKRIYFTCSNESYEPGDDFDHSLASVLDDVVNQTPKSNYDYYGTSSLPNNAIAFGHGACSGDLYMLECQTCMKQAFFQIKVDCEQKKGGQVQLKDCRIRYEDYPFVE